MRYLYVLADIWASYLGFTLFLWDTLLGWDKTEHELFLMQIRKEARKRNIHCYFTLRYVWGRKPQTPV